MADGDMITRDHQYEFQGVLLGSGTQYITESWDGLFDLAPNIQSSDLDRSDSDGVAPGEDLLGARTIETTINIVDPTRNVWPLLVALSTAFRPRRYTEALFSWRTPAVPGAILQIPCRPRKYVAPKDADLTLGMAKVAIQLVASKPIYYNRAVNSVNINQATGTATSQVVVNVVGNRPTPPKFTITGPMAAGTIITVTGQTAIDGTSDNAIQFINSYDLPSGQVAVIDMKAMTITVQGVAKPSFKTAAADWWSLYPGSQTVTITRPANAAAMTATMTWQDAWLL